MILAVAVRILWDLLFILVQPSTPGYREQEASMSQRDNGTAARVNVGQK